MARSILEAAVVLKRAERGIMPDAKPYVPKDRQLEFVPSPNVVARANAPAQKSRRDQDPRKMLIARIKSEGHIKVAEIAPIMDKRIERMSALDAEEHAPLDQWLTDSGCRSWEDVLKHKRTHRKVKTFINKVPRLPSEMSRKSA